jgi:hypothetical protein
MVLPFPAPPGPIQQILTDLAILKSGDANAIADIGDVQNLPRPWDPSSCGAEIRQHLWGWCDQVVSWLNHEYTWRPASMIPRCWPAHPHIARELPLLACQRIAADASTSFDAADVWHRQTFPLFLERLTDRLGESSCRNDKHIDWPAASRYHTAVAEDAVTQRGQAFANDTAVA